jgi:hypothetical protein
MIVKSIKISLSKYGCNRFVSEMLLNSVDSCTTGKATNCVYALGRCCFFYPRPEAAIPPYYADRWSESNGNVPWSSRSRISLLPVGQSEGHTLMDKSQQAGCACACNSDECGKNTIQAELVNVREVESVAGLIYALKLTVSN